LSTNAKMSQRCHSYNKWHFLNLLPPLCHLVTLAQTPGLFKNVKKGRGSSWQSYFYQNTYCRYTWGSRKHIADIHEDQGNGMLQLKQNLLYRIDSEGSKNIKAKWRWKIHSSLGIIEKLLQRISLLTFFIFFFRYWNK